MEKQTEPARSITDDQGAQEADSLAGMTARKKAGTIAGLHFVAAEDIVFLDFRALAAAQAADQQHRNPRRYDEGQQATGGD
jgi:hypothetical protein